MNQHLILLHYHYKKTKNITTFSTTLADEGVFVTPPSLSAAKTRSPKPPHAVVKRNPKIGHLRKNSITNIQIKARVIQFSG